MLPLSAADVHHASVVLRVRAGEELDIAGPDGRVWRVRVLCAGADGVNAVRLGEVTAVREPRVTLVFGVAKGSKNDDIVEGAVEIGVATILRAETAGVVATALVVHELGGLGHAL